MPYYGDTPGQAAGFEQADVESQRRYALGLMQQQIAAQTARNAERDSSVREESMRLGLADSAATRAQQASQFGQTLDLQKAQLAGTLALQKGAKDESAQKDLFNLTSGLIGSGALDTLDKVANFEGGQLGSDAFGHLVEMAKLANEQKSKDAQAADKYAKGLNNQILPQVTAIQDLEAKYNQGLAEGKKVETDTKFRTIKDQLDAARTNLQATHEKISKDLERAKMDRAIAVGSDGLFQSNLPPPPAFDTRPTLREPAGVTTGRMQRGLIPQATVSEPRAGLSDPESDHGGESAFPGKSVAPNTPVYVPIAGAPGLLVEHGKQVEVENRLLKLRAQFASDPARMAVALRKEIESLKHDRLLVEHAPVQTDFSKYFPPPGSAWMSGQL